MGEKPAAVEGELLSDFRVGYCFEDDDHDDHDDDDSNLLYFFCLKYDANDRRSVRSWC